MFYVQLGYMNASHCIFSHLTFERYAESYDSDLKNLLDKHAHEVMKLIS